MLTSAFKFDLSEEVFSFQRYFVLNHKCSNPEEQGSALNPVVFSLSLHLNGDPVSHALAHSVGLVRVEQIQLVRVLVRPVRTTNIALMPDLCVVLVFI